MMEKIAYLKGLMEGLGVNPDTKEGKIMLAMTDILQEMATAITGLEQSMDLVVDQIEGIDEDLEEMEVQLDAHLYDDVDLYDDEDDDDYEGELYEVTCPQCGDIICVDEDMLDEGEIDCPGCGETLEFDFGGDIDDEPEEDEQPKAHHGGHHGPGGGHCANHAARHGTGGAGSLLDLDLSHGEGGCCGNHGHHQEEDADKTEE